MKPIEATEPEQFSQVPEHEQDPDVGLKALGCDARERSMLKSDPAEKPASERATNSFTRAGNVTSFCATLKPRRTKSTAKGGGT